MELTTTETPARVTKTLEQHTALAAGGELELKLGADELATEVPAGKKWVVHTRIEVTEADA